MKIPFLQGIRNFLKPKFNLGLVIALILIGAFLVFSQQTTQVQEEGFAVHFFYLPTCPHCAEQKPIMLELQKEMRDINFFWHDASTPEGSQLFYKLATEVGIDTSDLRVPTIISAKHYLVGVHSKQEIKAMVEECKKECITANPSSEQGKTQQIEQGFAEFELPFIGRTNLKEFSLPVLAIVLGLIDGFNPCAMWVLVYLIMLLVEVNDRKKTWLIVGSFIFASAALYFLFMTAWLNFFLIVGYIRILTIAVGLVALGGGMLGLKEFFTAKGNLECKAEAPESQKKTMGKIEQIVKQPLSIAIILAIIALAFVVNSVEFVCSSAIPAVFTQILAMSDLQGLAYYGYIALYDFFFMLDDIIIFSIAAFAVNSNFMQKYAKYCKLFGGIILAALGIIMLFAPHLLR